MGGTGTFQNQHTTDRKVFSLSKLTESIAVQIDRTFSGAYWITAEISKLNHYPQSGHCYPQLVEKRDGQIVAEIRAFILNRKFKEINEKFIEVAGTNLGDGMQILFRCKVSYHPVFGLQLNLLDIEPSYTLGEMARQRQEAIEKLKKEGIFGQNKLLATPLLIRRLAVISVETSKGWRDFTQVIASSSHPNAIATRLFPALLQGDAAVGSIMAALEKIQRVHGQFDAVSIIRGGGGEVGLDCYDNYALGKVICTFPIPVITGIGHATNLTLVEQVAHKNLITPTDLARYITDRFTHFAQRIDAARRSITIWRRGWFQTQNAILERRKEQLVAAVEKRSASEKNKLNTHTRKLGLTINEAIRESKASLENRFPKRLEYGSRELLSRRIQSVEKIRQHLVQSSTSTIKEQQNSIALMREKVKLLDPVNALQRGYSITSSNGLIIKNAAALKPGDVIETRFAQGIAESTVKQTKNE
jgi:exodeoxyribonuclease VII large subunit